MYDLSRHPFLGIQNQKNTFWCLSGCKIEDHLHPGTYRHMTRESWDHPWEPIGGLWEAEDKVLQYILATEPKLTYRTREAGSYGWCDDGYVSLPVMVNRCCNILASRTRRMAGNVILIHEDTIKVLEGDNTVLTKQTHKPNGRWKQIGVFNSYQAVFTGPVPVDRVIVMLKVHDHDAIAYYDGDERFSWMPEGDAFWCGRKDYIETVKIDRSSLK